MASKNLFKSASSVSKEAKPANTINAAGGKAYKLSDAAALAQYAMTGCLNGTFYASDKDQFDKIIELSEKVDPTYIAKLAVYARQNGFMKDMPAVLAAILSVKDTSLLVKIFDKVIDDPKMLRNFVQIIRSGKVGRKSLGSCPKKLIQGFLEKLSDEQLFKADIGNDPSLSDIIKLTHPRPQTEERNTLFAYLLDKKYDENKLPDVVKEFESFKKDMTKDIPNVPFQMLTALPLTEDHWKKIAENSTWTQARMNLNSFEKHNVFKHSNFDSVISNKLMDEKAIKKANVFPYQLYTAYLNTKDNVPAKVLFALQKATEIACANIPEFKGKTYVFVDVSGSMGSPVTGNRGSATSKVSCVDVAALFASAILKKNIDAEVIMFDTEIHKTKLNPMDSICTNAERIAKFGGGGTDCHLPLALLNQKNKSADNLIYISDNESWCDNYYGNPTATMIEWTKFKNRNKTAKLINIDIQPSSTTQTNSIKDILNIGGFSDQIFSVIDNFIRDGRSDEYWVDTINKVSI